MTQQKLSGYPEPSENQDNGQAKKKGRAQEIDQYIGERLKLFRKQNRLTQEDLAEMLGISFQQVQKYENGKNRISFGRLYELSTYLKMPLEDFISGFVPDPAAVGGLSDNPQEGIDGQPMNLISQKETDELLKVYYSLEDPKLRKNLLKLVRSMADNMKD